jgi:hypothetical protein
MVSLGTEIANLVTAMVFQSENTNAGAHDKRKQFDAAADVLTHRPSRGDEHRIDGDRSGQRGHGRRRGASGRRCKRSRLGSLARAGTRP